jgi:hypothetical protein
VRRRCFLRDAVGLLLRRDGFDLRAGFRGAVVGDGAAAGAAGFASAGGLGFRAGFAAAASPSASINATTLPSDNLSPTLTLSS